MIVLRVVVGRVRMSGKLSSMGWAVRGTLCSLSAGMLSDTGDVDLHVRKPHDGFRQVGQVGVKDTSE